MQYIAFRNYSGGTMVAKVEGPNQELKIVNCSNTVAYKGQLNEASTLKIKECGIVAQNITEISEKEYRYLTLNEKIEAEAKEVEQSAKIEADKIRSKKERPERVKKISENKYVKVEPWGENVVVEESWLMSDGEVQKIEKVKKHL